MSGPNLPQRTEMTNGGTLRVVLEAQIRSGLEGGMEQVLIGLCHGFEQLCSRDKGECVIVGHLGGKNWIYPYIGKPGQSLE